MGLTFANKITIVRLFVVPFFISTMLSYSPSQEYLRYIALWIFLFAVITDVIDGYVARTRHEKTKAGAILDPLADKFLLISAFFCLYKISIDFHTISFPVWLVVFVISRDLILLLGALIIYIVRGDLNLEPTLWGKASTFFQIICVLVMLLQWPVNIYLWVVTLFFTLTSGADYIYKGIKIINNQK
jgi:cardiolipin synthase (CMP-forming)